MVLNLFNLSEALDYDREKEINFVFDAMHYENARKVCVYKIGFQAFCDIAYKRGVINNLYIDIDFMEFEAGGNILVFVKTRSDFNLVFKYCEGLHYE